LRRGLSNLQLLGHALACHVARPPWRCKQTSLQTSQRILDERDVGQSRAAESRPQLEPLLKRFLVIFIRCVFNDNSVASFADFAVLFVFALPLLWDFDKSRRRSRLRDKLHYFILQEAHWVRTTTTT
jgi:hypothetical protein